MSEMLRAQILLERKQHTTLMQIARRQHKSLSELTREIVRSYLALYEKQECDDALQALEELRAVREKQAVYPGDLVAEARAERERQMESVWQP